VTADAQRSPDGQSHSTAISVHLVDLPRMLEDALREVLAGDGFALAVGPPTSGDSSGATVIVMRSGPDPAAWMHQLLRRPHASLLLIEPRDCDAELVELWPSRRSQGVMDGASIAAALRSATSWDDRVSPAIASRA
jgi:hypothetical protein